MTHESKNRDRKILDAFDLVIAGTHSVRAACRECRISEKALLDLLKALKIHYAIKVLKEPSGEFDDELQLPLRFLEADDTDSTKQASIIKEQHARIKALESTVAQYESRFRDLQDNEHKIKRDFRAQIRALKVEHATAIANANGNTTTPIKPPESMAEMQRRVRNRDTQIRIIKQQHRESLATLMEQRTALVQTVLFLFSEMTTAKTDPDPKP